MNTNEKYPKFNKIPRLFKEFTITEKIDGTNALVSVSDDGKTLRAGSRNRWLSVDDDNFGFAKWVEENKEELLKLGPGNHYGEWWGEGIQRGYGLKEKRFSLFNTYLWGNDRPSCCHVVPVLDKHVFFETERVDKALEYLADNGSVAAPDFMNPEGVIIYHHASGHYYKATLDNDGPKEAS